jgi:hypothetical protein
MVNAAITSQLKRLNIDSKITDAIGGLKLDEKFEQLTKTLKPSGGDDPGPGDPPKKQPALPPEIAKQLQQLADQVEKEKEARLAAEKAREDAERSHHFESGRQRLYESLKEHAAPDLHDVWVDHLVHHKRLKVEDGTPLLEVEYSPVKGMPKQKDFLPLPDALQHLISSDDAKRFMAAPKPGNGGGTPGPRGAARSGASATSDDPMERVRARLAAHGIDFDQEFS